MSATTPTLPDPQATLSFQPISNMTACSPGLISWTYSGPQLPLILNITNVDIESPSTTLPSVIVGIPTIPSVPPSPLATESATTITDTADPLASNYTWQSVSVPQGIYVIEASMYNPDNSDIVLEAFSSPFSIANGTDVSCLSPPIVSHVVPTPESTSTSVPVVGGTKSNKGAIVAGVFGGLILVLSCLLCLFILRKRRRLLSRSWNGLTDQPGSNPLGRSKVGSLRKPNPNSKPKRKPGAARTSDPFSNSHGVGIPIGIGMTAPSDDDLTRVSHSEEKLNGKGSDVVILTGLAPKSDNDDVLVAEGITPLPYAYPTYPAPTRRSSVQSNHGSSRYREREGSNGSLTLENASYATHTTSVRRKSVDYRGTALARSHSSSTPRGTAPNNNVNDKDAEMVPMGINRSHSTGDYLKKSSRKPVPQYDPSEFNANRRTDTVELPGSYGTQGSLAVHGDRGTRGSYGSYGSYGSTRSSVFQARESIGNGNGGEVHYLIPDMPISGT